MSILSKVIGTTRILTNSKTLYGAYNELKDSGGDDEHLDFNAKHIPTSSSFDSTQKSTSQLSSQLDMNESSGMNSKKVLQVLNKVHNAMVHLGVAVEKIASHTAILVKNSTASMTVENVNKANAAARINEHEFAKEDSTSNPKKEQEGFISKLAKTFTEVSLTRALLPLIAEALAPLVTPLIAMLGGAAVVGGGVLLGKKISQSMEPGDQRPPGYHDETPYEGGTGKFGNEANAKTAQKILMDKGWSREQAAGIAGNLQAESKLDTKAVGDSGKAKGIAQWHPDRQAKFEQLSGKKIEDASFEDQVNFVDWELKNTEKKAGEKLKNAKTAEDAAKLFEKHYERDAVSSRGGYGKERVSYANEALKMELGDASKVAEKETPTATEEPIIKNGVRIIPYKESATAKTETAPTATEESKVVNGYKISLPKESVSTKMEEIPTATEEPIIKNGVRIIPYKESGTTDVKQEQSASKVEEAPTATKLKDNGNQTYIPYVAPEQKADQKTSDLLNVAPINKNLDNTATLEKEQKTTSGDIVTDVQNAPSPIQKAPDLTQDSLKKMADQSSKPQQPIVIQQQAATQQPEKPKTAQMLKVRNNDDPIWMWMQQELTKIV